MHSRLALSVSVATLAFLAGCKAHPKGATASQPDAASPAAPVAKVPKPPEATTREAVSASQVREQALALLMEASNSKDAEERYNSLEALIPVPSRLEPAARRGLTDPDDRVRVVAAMAVGKARLKTAAAFVRPLLDDKSELVQASAVYALSCLGEETNPQTLASLLQHQRPLFRAHAAYVLGEIGNPSALPMIRDAARQSDGRANPSQTRIYRLQLCEAMIKLGDERALDEVRAALFPSRPDELEATALAVQIIGQVKDRASQGQLVGFIDRVDPQAGRMPAEIRLTAAMSLAKMGHPQGGVCRR